MATRVTVAVLGDRNDPFETWGASMPEEDFARSYAEREKIELDVEDSELLIDVLGRAAAELGIDGPQWSRDPRDGIAFVSFYVPEDEDRYERSPYRHFGTSSLTLVDDHGRARWNVYFKEGVTYGEVLRAGEAGVLGGDPRRPYLILSPGIGNGMLVSWQDLVIAFFVIREVMGTFSDAGGALAFGKQILQTARDRIGKAKEPVENHVVDWTKRGGLPYGFAELLGRGPWHSADLAERLNCSKQEAEAILWAFGYTVGSMGLWRRGGDEAAELLTQAVDDVLTGPAAYEQHQLPVIIEERVRVLLETGSPPPEPEYELEEEFEEENGDNAIRRLARRVGTWLLSR
jgi:hypothetical protein